ncbi:MAG: serine/threonine-protein phosphatase [Clostridia bacterium]|nr:serine/threonine-protein phosphatase [Clostridia bacterium]
MNFCVSQHSDIGGVKTTNQDSCAFFEAKTDKGNIIMAVLCDGMGGLQKGEVASATIIKEFALLFENDLPEELGKSSPLEDIKYKWDRTIRELNQRISTYGRNNNIQLGSTLTALLILEDGNYLIGHVGDSRAYKITESDLTILTEDQTLVAREVKMGRLSPIQAKTDPRRNILLQCIGASKTVEPVFYFGKAQPGECYMLCSDGFRHTLSPEEIQSAFSPTANCNEDDMKINIERLINLNIERGETDNITSVLIKVQ